MNTDIRLSVGFWQHPKTKKIAKRLGLEGVRSLQVLWLWAAQNRPNGILSGMDWEDIELAADWRGEERAFFECCLSAEGKSMWIDEAEGGYVLHDWADHNPWQAEAESRSEAARKAARARWNNADAMRAQCEGNAGASDAQCEGNAGAFNPQCPSPLLSSPLLTSPKPNQEKEKRRETSLRSVSLSEPAGTDQLPEKTPQSSPEKKSQKARPKPAPLPLPEDSEPYRLAVLMLDTLKANVPTLKEPDLQKWAHSFDVAMRNDSRMTNPGFVAQVIRWACSDQFWRANIQSPGKLREKFDQLTAKMEAEAERARSPSWKWQSPAQRRVEANRMAGEEAQRLLFGNSQRQTLEVTYDAS